MIGNNAEHGNAERNIRLTYMDSDKPVNVNFNIVATYEPADKNWSPPTHIWQQELRAQAAERGLKKTVYVSNPWRIYAEISIGKRETQIPFNRNNVEEKLKGTFIRFAGTEIKVEQTVGQIEEALANSTTDLHTGEFLDQMEKEKARQWEPLRQRVMEAGAQLIEQAAQPKKWFPSFRGR